ncbi:hypothetical protein BAE44_0018649, partial [Dichanthelium oligosanthes]
LKQSCFNVSHVDRNLRTASLSVHRAGFCDYIYYTILFFVLLVKFIYGVKVSQHSQLHKIFCPARLESSAVNSFL